MMAIFKTKAEAEKLLRKRKRLLKEGKKKLRTDVIYKTLPTQRKQLEKGFDVAIDSLKIKKIKFQNGKMFYEVLEMGKPLPKL